MTIESDPSYPAHWEADVVLRDGGTARIRPITTEDAGRLVSFYEQVSDESKYYRFFAPYPRLSDRDVHRFTHHDYVDRVGLAATIGEEFIGTVRYDRIGPDGRPASAPADEAEVAFLVQDAHQGRGVASALLEHIGAVARERGIRRFAAEVLPANTKMIKVFTDVGYEQKRSFEDGSVHLTLDLEPTAESLAVQRAREQRAEARSVQRLLAPGSVAVVGVSRSGAGVGAAALRNLRDSGFHGHLYAVNEAVTRDLLDGVRAYRSVEAVGAPVDLAVIAVPADRVPDAVAACGEHGVQGLVVLSAGYGDSGPAGLARQRELLRQVRSYGMRLIGPNAYGVINTAPEVELNASLTPAPMPTRGRTGLFTQSGAIGIALLSALLRRGEGLSSFVSAGNRADVSGNDILQYWYEDEATDVALLYLETLGNPRKFTRLARRTAAVKPVVVAKGGRHTPAGHVVPGTRLSEDTVSALLRQAGVIRVDTVTELVDVGLLLASQPLPAGPRIAILGNSESLGVLTYDACLTQGLRPLPPLDLTTAASPADFRTALAAALASDDCDAVVVTAIPWVSEHALADDLADALREAVAEAPGKPVAVVHVELAELVQALSATRGPAAAAPDRPAADSSPWTPAALAATTATADPDRIPSYPAAERAVKAVAEAVRYGQWRRALADAGQVPEYEDIDEAGAAAQLAGLLADVDGGAVLKLSDWDARELLARYGIRVLPTLPAPSADAAVRAAVVLGYPVALKTTAPHLRHRADLGGVRLDLTNEAELRRSYEELTDALGKPAELQPVVQAMVPRGVDTVVRSVIDPAAGAVLSFGLAGVASELLGDTAHRLVPATDRDAAGLIRSIRAAPLLFGWRGSDPVDTPALEEVLLRLSRLVDDHPEVIGVSLEPVVVAAEGISVLSATVRVAHPPARGDLGPRTLPSY
ncbi:bifunctional GNAT family N-acetyltransferase/acetate--CoA ligase family protein [Streptomyces sp. A0592]|uniref:bifunctional acetate--CoA ligase family protein/GNAT family N-acetyltransferase n=1 Tax=Streptomyces sp. A0592 TaxID=2563099 RepID=UPI00109E6EAB|nr:bifunctional GNAT family N-acetyltransferase/acetate--CoA ligase family protein [Streptomyces sp. A0592]THA85195.1 GNAT family N-acetyltransferase [Streptomyces sp. A0592]